MRSLRCSTLALSLAFAAPLAAAQEGYEDTAARLEQSMADAQAQAQRPGDEDLACEQLESEMTTLMRDPAMQAFLAEQGAYSEEQLARMNAARGRARAQMGVGLFLGIASGFVPGLGYAQMAQQQMQAAQAQRDAEANMAQMTAMADRMTPIMPQMMRGQRVHDLAQAKQCAFVQPQ
jgi:hypothetical protein